LREGRSADDPDPDGDGRPARDDAPEAAGRCRREEVEMSSLYSRIACCVDRDDMASEVLAESLRLAGGSPGVVHAVHVVAPPHMVMAGPYAYVAPMLELRDEAEAWLDDLTDDLPGVSPVLLMGHPAREVCRWAAEAAADLIVAMAHRGAVERAILGGFASYLAYRAPCTVTLLHPADVVRRGRAARAAAA
jgi:nucleotide-binding universal stress UspA family protein